MLYARLAVSLLMQSSDVAPSATAPRLPDEALVDMVTRGTVVLQCGKEQPVLSLAIATTHFVVLPPDYKTGELKKCTLTRRDGLESKALRVRVAGAGPQPRLLELDGATLAEGLRASELPQDKASAWATLKDGVVTLLQAPDPQMQAVALDGDGAVVAALSGTKGKQFTAIQVRDAVIAIMKQDSDKSLKSSKAKAR